MSVFTPKELEYLQSQRLGRLATVNPDGQPQNAPVSFRYNAELDVIDIAGMNMSKSQKFKNILQNPRVAFVIDDVLPPWQARGVEIRGTAEALYAGGEALYGGSARTDAAFIRIHAVQIIGWGIDTDPYKQNNRKVTAEK